MLTELNSNILISICINLYQNEYQFQLRFIFVKIVSFYHNAHCTSLWYTFLHVCIKFDNMHMRLNYDFAASICHMLQLYQYTIAHRLALFNFKLFVIDMQPN